MSTTTIQFPDYNFEGGRPFNLRQPPQNQVSLPDPCGKSTVEKINVGIFNFFNNLKVIKEYGQLYVVGGLNILQDVTSLISSTSEIIASALKSLVQRLRNFIMERIRKFISKQIDKILPTIGSILKEVTLDQVVNQLQCAFDKIILGLKNFVIDFLQALVEQILNPAFCAIEGFTSALINSLSASIDKALEPILSQLQDFLGGAFKVVGIVFEAIDYILGFESFFCQPKNCPEIKKFIPGAWNGPNKTEIDNFNKIRKNIPSAGTAIDKADQLLGDFFGKDSDVPAGPLNCNTNPYECGLPEVTLFGGGGFGAAGLALVNNIGEVVGVDLIYPGTDYKKPPFITFTDSCGNGNYASGYTEINSEGQVTRIVITNSGGGYLSGPNGLDEFGNVVGTTSPPEEGQEVSNGGIREYVGCIVGFDVLNTGIGYTIDDQVTLIPDVSGLNAVISITPEGQIINVTLTSSTCGITEIPKVVINSENGAGAVIRPQVEFTRISSTEQYLEDITSTSIPSDPNAFDKNKLLRVVDCIK